MTTFTTLPDLASRRLGGGVVYANDELFAAADNLVTAGSPEFRAGTFGPKGQVYDGWETRRRRESGSDHAVVRLGAPGVVHGLVIDTAHFTGNYPPHASVEACRLDGYPDRSELEAAEWTPLLPMSELRGDTRNEFPALPAGYVTHVRLTIYPDGGVARLRVHGEPVPDPRMLALLPVDLGAIELGGRVVDCSDMFYGSPNNLLTPGLAGTMGEGWETRRRRDAGNDWVLVRLAGAGRLRVAELDTTHFKGNAPGAAALRAVDARAVDARDVDARDGAPADGAAWFDLLPRVRLQPDTRHRFALPDSPVATHVRMDVYPDGGMARLRLYGTLEQAELDAIADRRRQPLTADRPDAGAAR